MFCKFFLRPILEQLKLLWVMQTVNYWLTRFDRNSIHPKRVMFRFYSQFIEKGDLCFDIGANIGNRTEIFLELGAKVGCVEPQSSCQYALRKLFSNNRKVNIIPKGIADQEGVLNLYVCKAVPTASTMSPDVKNKLMTANIYGDNWTPQENVPITTLDILIAEYGIPDFCKIDIEGLEEKALMGLTKKISLMSFEFRAGFFDDMKRCINRLLQIGNYKFNFAVNEPTNISGSLQLPQWVDREELYKELYNKLQQPIVEEDLSLYGDIYAKLF